MTRIPAPDAPALWLARAAVGAAPAARFEPAPAARRRGVEAATRRLIEATLARGCVLALARRGGWARARHVVDEEVVEGRLWERHSDLELRFSPFTMRLILHLALGGPRPGAPKTGGDDLFAYLAADVLARRGPLPAALAGAPLVWLAFPGQLGDAAPPSPEAVRASVARAPVVLEALQADLTDKVVALERAKASRSTTALLRLGPAQAAALGAYLDAVEDRPDLARFLLAAAGRLASDPRPERWFAPGPEVALSERAAAGRAVAALLVTLGRLEGWRRRAAAVRFFDEGFDRAQLYLEDWARLGDAGYARLQRVAAALGDPTAGGSP